MPQVNLTSLPANGNTIDAVPLATALTSLQAAINAIDSTQIGVGSVTATALASGSVTASALASGSVTSSALATGSVTASALGVGSVGTSALAASSVVAAVLANGAVSTSKIASAAITSSLLASDSVTSGPLAPANTLTQVGWFAVKDFGAVGDGTTDDTAAFVSAIAAAHTAGGGWVHVPQGQYVVSSALTMQSNISIIGAGYPQTQLKCTGSTLTAGVFTGASLTGLRFENFGITFPTHATAGSVFGLTGCNYVWIRNVLIGNAWNDVTINGGLGHFVEHIITSKSFLPGANNTCDSIYITGDATEIHINGCVLGTTAAGSQSACRAGIHIDYAQAVNIIDCDVMQFYYGLLVNPGAGQKVYNTQIIGTPWDFCSSNGIFMTCTTNTSGIYMIAMYRCWSGGAQGDGAILSNPGGGTFDSILITSHQCVNNARNGMTINGVSNILVSNGLFGSNGIGINSAQGIYVLNCIRANIIGNLCSNVPSYPVPNGYGQAYGITWETSNTNFQVMSNDCSNNRLAGCGNPGTTSTYRIRNNVGFNPVGQPATTPPTNTVNTSIPNPYGIDATVYVSGGTLTGIYANGVITGLLSGAFHIPAGGSIQFNGSVAPTNVQWVLN